MLETDDSFGSRFGRLMQRVRGDLGVTQSDLAEQVFGSKSRKGDISRLENGNVRGPQAATVANICGALGIDPAEVDALRTADDRALDGTVERLLAENAALTENLKLSHALAVSLAYDYAEGNPTDFDGAMRGLRRALEVAAEEKARDALPSNLDEAVSQIVRRVDELNELGETRTAAALIADEETRAEAGLIRLYDKGIAQAILTRDAAAACAYELKKLPLDTPDPTAQFDALRSLRRSWLERGRDKGLNFDLEVSIALARASLSRAKGADETGAAGNDLGISLDTLGEREPGTERLELAVTAYRNALEEWTRDRMPLEWAMTQMNLAGVELAFFRKTQDKTHLDTALTHDTAAREVFEQARAGHYLALADRNIAVIKAAYPTP